MCTRAQAQAALAFPNAYGVTVRYAMKSSPNAAILKARAPACAALRSGLWRKISIGALCAQR
jgi:hypothetical protein